jgi:hypothetical protein
MEYSPKFRIHDIWFGERIRQVLKYHALPISSCLAVLACNLAYLGDIGSYVLLKLTGVIHPSFEAEGTEELGDEAFKLGEL